jgi:TfoX/Sxy family transcriptional regulator of competence genes
MFGGHGLFLDDLMLALITRAEVLHLKADDENHAAFEAVEMKPHGKRPCHQVRSAVMEEAGALLEWAEGTVTAARRAKPARVKGKSRR